MTTPNKTPPGADPKQLERTGTVREIGSQAVWSLSSCKPGFGVDQLRDDNLETYWQSDGSQPHLVNIQFRRKTTVKTLCIYADYKSDESYTPSKISVRVGNNFHNLQEIRDPDINLCGSNNNTNAFRKLEMNTVILRMDAVVLRAQSDRTTGSIMKKMVFLQLKLCMKHCFHLHLLQNMCTFAFQTFTGMIAKKQLQITLLACLR
ncbi:anaphase-promoting complex subunit 10 isoform X2 [Struthio camelus]|uniref:anaphase-promoting complex subunit 10 isoform X2 n=1 Tax=Struthio camelus TaxID=8801 RepID=UPI0036040E7A